MTLIYPIADKNWLRENSKFLNISEECFNNLIKIDSFVESKDWMQTRKTDHKKLINSISSMELISSHATISVVYIVKNEENYILNSLDSITDLADEIIIVDTGSSDNTLNILNQIKSDKINLYTFEWCDDFSKARNFANERATCEWILTLDADEIVQDYGILKFFLSYLKLFDNFEDTVFNLNVVRGDDSYKTGKLIRNTNTFRYKGRVHEIFYSDRDLICYANLKVKVLGQKRYSSKKIEYYNKLLIKTMIDFPRESRWCYLFIRDNFKDLRSEQILTCSKSAIFKEGDTLSKSNFIENYYSIRIIFFLMFKLLEENKFEMFGNFMKIIEDCAYESADFKFLKFSYELSNIQINVVDSLKLFLEEYNSCDHSETVFSKECLDSLLGEYLFWGGFLEESRQVFKELETTGRNYPRFLSYYFFSHY